MTCYLTDGTTLDEIEKGYVECIWIAATLYPAGATTNAHHGIANIAALAPVLERMEKIWMPLLIHGEAVETTIDAFDREAMFMEESLLPPLKRHQGLKVVIEHVTTAEAVDIVRAHKSRAAATITPHHLVLNRSSMFEGGLRPHFYCLPVAKREHIVWRCVRRPPPETAVSSSARIQPPTCAVQSRRCAARLASSAAPPHCRPMSRCSTKRGLLTGSRHLPR